jgi:small subunit ribosomal protein S16
MIRLARVGAKKKPHFRVVVIEKEKANRSRFVEIVGYYDPRRASGALQLNWERVQYWLQHGAQPSDTVRSFLKRHKPESEPVASPAA